MVEFGSRLAKKLRKQGSTAGSVTVFIRTNPFNPNEPQYQRAASTQLDATSQDTRVIVSTANRLLDEIYKPGYGYHNAGVQLSRIEPIDRPGQIDLFDNTDTDLLAENRPLMQVIDHINRRYPKGIAIASAGLDKSWKLKPERISQRYTTDWRELVGVH